MKLISAHFGVYLQSSLQDCVLFLGGFVLELDECNLGLLLLAFRIDGKECFLHAFETFHEVGLCCKYELSEKVA